MDKVLNESLRQNDLEFLVSPYVSVDQYTSKIKSDNITIAFFCNQLEVAKDLSDFLEKLYPIEISDIEIAETLTEDNKNIVYVELERNQMFPKILIDIIDSIDFLINCDVDDWDFITFGMKNKEKLSYEALLKNVRLVPLETEAQGAEIAEEVKESVEKDKEQINERWRHYSETMALMNNYDYKRGYEDGQESYKMGHYVPADESDPESNVYNQGYEDGFEDAKVGENKFDELDDPFAEEVTETVQYSKDGITRTYLDEGVITQEELDKMIEESETLNENSLDKEILEYNFPDCQVITTDNHAFIIDEEIKKLGC